MGYTHYFRVENKIENEEWDNLIKDVKVILKHIKKNENIQLQTDDYKSKTLVNKFRININGVGDDNYETFYLEKNKLGYNFCKTGRMPYDLAVCSILLLVHEHMPNKVNVSSDGDFEEWKEAADMNFKVLKKGFTMPPSINSEQAKLHSNGLVAEILKEKNNNLLKKLNAEEKPILKRKKII